MSPLRFALAAGLALLALAASASPPPCASTAKTSIPGRTSCAAGSCPTSCSSRVPSAAPARTTSSSTPAPPSRSSPTASPPPSPVSAPRSDSPPSSDLRRGRRHTAGQHHRARSSAGRHGLRQRARRRLRLRRLLQPPRRHRGRHSRFPRLPRCAPHARLSAQPRRALAALSGPRHPGHRGALRPRGRHAADQRRARHRHVHGAIDSGSNLPFTLNATGLNPSFKYGPRTGPLVATLSGDAPRQIGRLAATLVLGTVEIREPRVMLTDQLPTIGAEILRHFITFDQHRAPSSSSRRSATLL